MNLTADDHAQADTHRTYPWWRGYGVRVMLAISLLSLTIILLTAVVSHNTLRDKTIAVASQALSSQASILRNDLEGRIVHLVANIAEMSNNPLFANALADDIGRNVYLRDFIAGLSTTEGFVTTIAMTNFRGELIHTNHWNTPLVVEKNWIRDAIDKSVHKGAISIIGETPFLILAEPLIFRNTGTAEGALVYQIDLSQWLRSTTVDRTFREAPWLSSLHLADTTNDAHIDGQNPRASNLSSQDPDIFQYLDIPDYIEGKTIAIHLTASSEFVQAPLNELLVDTATLSAMIFAASLLGSAILSRALTSKLRRLRDEASKVSEAKSGPIQFTDQGHDEIDELAGAFSALIDELQSAYSQLEDESRREIAARERHYQSIVDNSAEGIITISDQGIIETFNPSAERIFGYKADEMIGKTVNALMPAGEREAHDQYLKHTSLHTPRIVNRSRDLTGLRKTGETFPLELNVSPMDIGGRHKFIGILRDISERKEFEDRITAARVEAEQANKAKSQFLSSMSHELRTPLNAILGFGQLLEMSAAKLTDQQAKAVKQILKGGNHLLELIDQVLNLAKIESGNLPMSIEPVDVRHMLTDSLTMAQSMADARAIRVYCDLPPEHVLIFVDADRTRMQQILLNLLSNAIKYNMPGGSIILSYAVDDERGMCRFAVADTGPGIAENMRAQVFAPFDRLGAENSDIEGTGIGLTITRELVLMMKGEIDFTSEVGKGSTFWFSLPLTPKNRRPDAILDESAVPGQPFLAEQQGPSWRTVLYIEDNPSNLQLMEMMFDEWPDWKLLTATTAEGGIAMVKAAPPNLILMDINLPGMSGIEAMRFLKGNVKTADIPVIAVSANAMPSEISEAMAAGFTAYLTKPLDFHKIQQSMLAALDDVVTMPS